MTLTKRNILLLVLSLSGMVILSGCATEERVTSDGRPMNEPPRRAPVTPADATVDRMALLVGSKLDDTTGNGYPDTITATVALFASAHPTAMRVDGAFEFKLYAWGSSRGEAAPLAAWRIEGEALKRTFTRALYGDSYTFRLSLAEAGTDRYPLSAADLRCAFYPADGGEPIHSDGVRPIQIGRR